MTIQSSASSVTYTGNSSTTIFPFSFIISDESQLVVSIFNLTTLVDTALSPSVYGVNGIGNPSGGFITYPLSGSPIDSKTTITTRRVLSLVQQTDIVNQSAFYPETLEDALDYQMMVSQQLQEQISRALIAPAGSGLDSTEYLNAILNAGSDAQIYAAAAQDNAVLSAYYASVAQGFATGTASAITYDPTSSGLLATNVQSAIDELAASAVVTTAFIGQITDSGAISIPSLWLACDGSAVSRTTYALLWAALSRSSVVTMTIASPTVITWNTHGRVNDDPITLSTTGALPTGLAAGTVYYVKNKATNTFQLSATPGGAAINTSGTQSGVHTAIYAPWGAGNGTTTFNVPDLDHRATYGYSPTRTRLTKSTTSGLDGTNIGNVGGTEDVQLSLTQIPAHGHPYRTVNSGGFGTGAGGIMLNDSGPTVRTNQAAYTGALDDDVAHQIGGVGGGLAHNNVPPGVMVRKIIYAGA